MALDQPSLDQMLATIPPQLLDQKITNDVHLAKVAQSLFNWKEAVSSLGLSKAEGAAIEEENLRLDDRRYARQVTVPRTVCVNKLTYRYRACCVSVKGLWK